VREPRPFKTEHRNLPAQSFREKFQGDLEKQTEVDRENRRNDQVKQAAKEFNPATAPKYDYQRRTMTPLEFAEHVLKCHGMLHRHHGHEWLDGLYATPARKIEYANAALARLKLLPVSLGRRS
jgi:hypothetical protein